MKYTYHLFVVADDLIKNPTTAHIASTHDYVVPVGEQLLISLSLPNPVTSPPKLEYDELSMKVDHMSMNSGVRTTPTQSAAVTKSLRHLTRQWRKEYRELTLSVSPREIGSTSIAIVV